MRVNTGSDFENTGGNFADAPGWYHMIITGVNDRPTKASDGSPLDAAAEISCIVAESTVPDSKDKTFDLMLWNPKPSQKNGGAFAQKKIDRFLIAVGVLKGLESEKGKEVDIDPQSLVGRQFVVELEKEEGKRAQMAFANIFHVDDPEVKTQPKNQQMLSVIPSTLRLVGGQPTSATPPATAPPMNVADVDI